MKTLFIVLICSFLLISSLSAINVKLCYPLTGWTPDSKKKFILSSDKEILTPISYSVQKNNEIIKNGTLIPEGYHWGFFLYSADISTITDSGFYTIKVLDFTEGKVEISNDIFKKFKSEKSYISIPDMLHSFWNYQRCYPEKCNNPNNDKRHQDDSNLPLYRSLPNSVRIQQAGTSKELYGGWHDATSTDKESFDIGGVVSQMGIAVLNMKDPLVVEPLLQEIRWGTDYLLKLQEEDGSFCVQVWIKADWVADSPPRHLTVNKGIGVAARCALGLVVASEVFKDLDPGYSQKCLSSAKKAWDFVERNPMKWMQDSIEDWWCGNSGTLVRTSAELARITGENRYISAVEKTIREGTFNHTVHFDWGDYVVKGIWAKKVGTFPGQIKNDWIGYYDEVSLGHAAIGLARYYKYAGNDSIRQLIRTDCNDFINWVKEKSNNPFGVCEHLFNPWFGMSQNYSALALHLIHIGIELNIPEAIDLGIRNYEWIVGFNPFGASCVVGVGNEPIVQPYMRSVENTIGGIVPGMLFREMTVNGVKDNYLTLDWPNKTTEPWNQWIVGEAGMGAGALIELTALLNKRYNPSDHPVDLIHTVVPDERRNIDLVVFPNPSTGLLTIQKPIGTFRFELFNLEGQIVMNSILDKQLNQFDISSIKAGIYVLKVRNSQMVFTKRIVLL